MSTRPTGPARFTTALVMALFALLPLAQARADAPPVAVGLTLDEHTVQIGETITGTLTLDIREGWGVWPADAALISDDFFSAEPLVVRLDAATAAWATLNPIEYPQTTTAEAFNPLFGDLAEVNAYAGTLEIPVSFEVTADTEVTTLALDIAASTFSNQDEPGTIESIAISAGVSNPNAPQPVTPRAEFFGITMPDFTGPVGTVLLFIVAIVAGFVLNLTPCVLPVIPLKVMTLTSHAGESKKRALVLGLWMACGVVAFWAVVGAPLAILVAVSERWIDPSALIFGEWYITLGLGIVIAVMGLGIMGLFSISLPQKAYMVNPSVDNAQGSFLFGVMAAVLGLPCFGFVVGPLLAGAASMPPLVIMSVFVGLGVGMAAPYLVFSIFPSLLSWMPKAGPASELIKQVMGLALIAGAIFFLAAGINSLFKAFPFLSSELTLWLVVLCLVATGLWLTLQTFKITKSLPRRVIFGGLGLLVAGASLMFAYDSGGKAHARAVRIAEAQEAAERNGYTTADWNTYTPDLVQKATDAGQVVIIDFTADWCINCKVLKRTILEPNPVGEELWGPLTVPVKADIDYPAAKAFHAELGLTGIPQLMIIGPGLDTPWISSGYTADQVLAAIESAMGDPVDTTVSQAR